MWYQLQKDNNTAYSSLWHNRAGMQFMGKLANRKVIVILQSHAKSISVHCEILTAAYKEV